MKRAQCLIREALVYRRAAFVAGLHAAGYQVVGVLNDPAPDDVLVIWNRYGENDAHASRFERAGARVVVVENGYFGKSWLGDRWFAMALGQHGGAGKWFPGGLERWAALGIPLLPWRSKGRDIVIFAQRGIGSPSVRSPDGWAQRVQKQIGGRIRAHPGKHPPAVSLEDDLREAAGVITWASSAAIAALVVGVPIWCAAPWWIGAPAARSLTEFGSEPRRDDAARLEVMRRVMWAMWRAREVEDGTAFRHLLRDR